MEATQEAIFSKAVNQIAASLKRPLIYGPNNKPLRPVANYQYTRRAAKREGSMKNWNPRQLMSRQEEAMERTRIVERSIDLTNSDPHAAGIVETFATTVVGSGLTPHPTLDPEILGMKKEEVRQIQAQQRAVFQEWAPFADAGGRLSFGSIQFLMQRSLLQFGEYLVLLPMMNDTTRPYSLACQVIHPLRLKTPTDLASKGNIKEGIELGKYGEAIAYWIKKAFSGGFLNRLSDDSKNFLRIPTKQGHRWKVLHGFMAQDPEQVRGIPFFAPALKFFRDLNDFLDAELVSNVVTAAFALFIEAGDGMDPNVLASALAGIEEAGTNPDGSAKTTRYEELDPGGIMYGNQGEKPHAISANRPGATFEPFVTVIKKAIALSVNMPYPVVFKDVGGTNFAGFRSAMLDAWRVFMAQRQWLGQECQKPYTMLMEEAYLRGRLAVKDFYGRMHAITRVEWRGTPKGDIEPVKAAQADKMLIESRLKTRAEAIAERGGDLRTTLEQLEEEEELLEEKGLKGTAPSVMGQELNPAQKEDQNGNN